MAHSAIVLSVTLTQDKSSARMVVRLDGTDREVAVRFLDRRALISLDDALWDLHCWFNAANEPYMGKKIAGMLEDCWHGRQPSFPYKLL